MQLFITYSFLSYLNIKFVNVPTIKLINKEATILRTTGPTILPTPPIMLNKLSPSIIINEMM